MAKVNSGTSGCRAVVMAGKYLSTPGLSRSPGERQRRMFGPQRLMVSSDAGARGKSAALAQHEHQAYPSAAERHVLTKHNLVYRDVRAFLSEVGGDPREARYWLTQFQRATSAQSPAFAVLEVGRGKRGVSCFARCLCFLTTPLGARAGGQLGV